MKLKLLPCFLLFSLTSFSQNHSHLELPSVLNEFSFTNCQLTVTKNGQQLKELDKKEPYTFSAFSALAKGTESGIELDLKKPGFNGSVAYGPYNAAAEFPTVSFLPKTVKLLDGKALLELKSVFTKANDFFKLAEKAEGIIGYRIMDADGRIVYEGRCAFKGKGPYKVLPAINEGPFVNILNENGCTISYETQIALKTKITVGNLSFEDEQASKHHEIKLSGLQASTHYTYIISYGERSDNFQFTTAAKAGSRQAFTFAFASANRANTGGGEKDFGGTNYQSTRALMAAALQNKAVFMQNMGDITNGGNVSEDGHLLEYGNFKRALEPFWSKVPVYLGFGDHEVNYFSFEVDTVLRKSAKIDRFPYATESGEASFARAFVHPQNGPDSEDGASYDPNITSIDFPSYKENVYSYTYDNVAMIVLNTEYWKAQDPKISGSPEGYIMDQQVKWLDETIKNYEKDATIDHIFVNVHSAVFPNGDHANGAMWYDGNNNERAKVAGQKVSKGILERRDDILDLCVNKSKKFLAFISGDEHNFAFLQVNPEFSMYPKDYSLPKLKLSRPFYHINNGGGGAAAYAMLPTPWTKQFQFFTEPPVLAFIHIKGKSVSMSAINAETFGTVCQEIKLR